MRDTLLAALARWSIRHPWRVLGIAAALSVASIWTARDLDISLSFADQLPEDARERQLLEYGSENFGGMDLLFVVLRGEGPEQLAAAADAAAGEIAGVEGYVAQVLHRVDLGFFRRHGLLYAPPSELEALVEDLEGGGAAGEATRALLSAGDAGALAGGIGARIEAALLEDEEAVTNEREDLLSQLSALEGLVRAAAGDEAARADETLESLFGQERAEVATGGVWSSPGDDPESAIIDDHAYFLSEDRTAALLLVRPTRQDYDYGFSGVLMEAVRGILTEVSAAHPGVSWELTGNLAVMHEENEAITKDMAITSGVALIGILLVFFFIFRQPLFLVVVGVPLVTSVIWTFGVVALLIGHFNVTTAIFGPILMGLGIDFSIHLIARWLEERSRGGGFEPAILTAITVSGRGLITGGLTTAGTFFVLGTARFKGMSEMGLIAGVGILLELVAMLVMVPALLRLFERRLEEVAARPVGGGISERIADAVSARPRFALVVGLLLTLLGGWGATQLAFNYDIRSIEPEGMPSMEALRGVERTFGLTVDYGMVLADDAAQEATRVEALSKLKTVAAVESAATYLPEGQEAKLPYARRLLAALGDQGIGAAQPPAAQAAGFAQLARSAEALLQAAILAGEFEVEDGARRLQGAAAALAARLEGGAAPLGLKTLSADLREALADLRGGLKEDVEAGGLRAEDLPPALRGSYLGKDGRRLIYAYPAQNLWDERFMGQHLAELEETAPGDVLGIAVVFHALMNGIRTDFRAASFYALLVVLALVLLDFRRPGLAFAALLPLVAGALWMLGTMTLFGMEANYVNVGMVPIVLGIGIDDGVHMLHRFIDERRGGMGLREAIHEMTHHTGRAVLLTSLTTGIGFGAIGLAHHRGLASLGIAVALGIFTCYLAAVTLLPALLSLGVGRRLGGEGEPGEGGPLKE